LKSLIEHITTVNERFTELGIWDILLQCATALEHFHNKSIIHLDLKPENIFITEDNVLKIGDFGLSTSEGVPPTLHSEGDKYYMAPEVLEGHYSKAADIFSLGLIVLELAADIELPSNGDSWQNLRQGDYSELSLEDTSDMLNQLIKEMTHPIPESRPSIEKVLWRAKFFFSKLNYNVAHSY
jgi:mitosis inhibitor protein kinase SWE1